MRVYTMHLKGSDEPSDRRDVIAALRGVNVTESVTFNDSRVQP